MRGVFRSRDRPRELVSFLGVVVRWNKIRYSFSHALYASELILNPLPFALAAAFLSPAFPLFVLIARYLQLALLNRALRAGLTWRQLALTPCWTR